MTEKDSTIATGSPGRKARELTPNQQKRRQDILSAARAMVAEHGYDGTIMRDVAVRAKVSPTTLYNLYNTKDELLLAALRQEVIESNQRAASETDRPGHEYLLRSLYHVARQTRKQPAYVEAISRALLRANAGDPLVNVLLIRLRDDARNSLAAMAERSELAPGTNIDAIAVTLAGAFWSSFLLWGKGLIKLQELEATLQRNYLSILIPVSRGQTKTDLEKHYRSLDA